MAGGGGGDAHNSFRATRTKGIYIFSASPFRQRAFAGFATEMANIARLHWRGALFFGGVASGAYYVTCWARQRYLKDLRKNPADYDREYLEISAARDAQAGQLAGDLA